MTTGDRNMVETNTKKKMLIEGMSKGLGGVEKFIYTLFQILKNDWDIDFLTVDEEIPFQKEFLDNGCHIYKITPRYVSVKKNKDDIDRVFRTTNYDVFWFNKTSLSSIVSLKKAKMYNVKNIICHSHSSENMGNFFTMLMHKKNQKWVENNIIRKVACSENAARWFFNASHGVHILPNAVDVEQYEPNKIKQKKIKEELGIQEEFVIGHVGRFSKEKNHEFLIKIFFNILKKIDAHLILCGDGELRNHIENHVLELNMKDKVSFLGQRNDIPDVLQAMDVFVLPSLFEGLPFVLVEAQASGIPCIVSETVSKEAALTDLVHYISLESDIDVWVEKILKYKCYEKTTRKKELTKKGFTIEHFIDEINILIN